jgi:hypothetical protein
MELAKADVELLQTNPPDTIGGLRKRQSYDL